MFYRDQYLAEYLNALKIHLHLLETLLQIVTNIVK